MIENILITGASKGVGHALCEFFASKGINVYAVARTLAPLTELAARFKNITAIKADVSQPKDRESIYREIPAKVQSLSIINNAAITSPVRLLSLDDPELNAHLQTNVVAPIMLAQRFADKLSGQRVLNISSGAAELGLPGLLPYCVSKAALEHATTCMNAELSAKSIFCSVLRPGMVDTPMEHQFREAEISQLPGKDYYCRVHSSRQLIEPLIVAEFVYWVITQTTDQEYCQIKWNIYDQALQTKWLSDKQKAPKSPKI